MKIVIILLVVVYNDFFNLIILMFLIDCLYKYLFYNMIYGINICIILCYIVKYK